MKNSVLVVIVYTDFKHYSRPLVPKIYDDLECPNKSFLFVTDENCPGLSDYSSGEMVAAMGRDFGIKYARKHNFDWVFFLDVDTIADKDTLLRLLACDYPLVGGVHVARGNATNIIGHNYTSFKSLERIPLDPRGRDEVIDVDGTSGGVLLVNRSIFGRVDYAGYQGPNTIPGRFTADDEFLEIKIRRQRKVKPKLDLGAMSWHLSEDGFAYRWHGQVKKYKKERDIITFQGRKYVKG